MLIALTRIAAIALLMCGGNAFGQTPPNPPVITEPTYDGKIVNPADVHMETLPFSDPDLGDTHQCTDWEIWTVSPFERVWVTSCIGGIEKVHTHLGDGTFENSHAGRSELFYDTNYELHVRHRDNTNLWSAFSIRTFTTGSQTQIFPLSLDDASDSPAPALVAETGDTLVLPGGGAPPSVRIESDSGSLLLSIAGLDGLTNDVTNPGPLPDHAPVRVVAEGGGAGLALPQYHVIFTDDHGVEVTVYLPAMNVAAGDAKYFWVAANGSSYVGDSAGNVPDFSVLAQGATVPWKVFAPGYKVEIVASGFALPVNIAFVPNPGLAPNSPFYYVTELYGQIKVVTRDGTISTYADSLLNFDPGGNFPGSGEQGLSGVAVDSATGDVFANMLYDASPPSVLHYPKVVRFHSNDGGLTAAPRRRSLIWWERSKVSRTSSPI